MRTTTAFEHRNKGRAAWLLVAGTLVVLIAGAATGSSAPRPSAATVRAVGAENEYANVIGQIGGRYVSVNAIMSNPNTDPHTFEASPVPRKSSAPHSLSFKMASATTASWTRSKLPHRARHAR